MVYSIHSALIFEGILIINGIMSISSTGASVDDSDSFTSDSELDQLSAADFLNEISDVDAKINAVRFSDNHSVGQIIDRISALMEHRNHLHDKLQEAKARELKAFIDSMALADIGVKPFYPAPERCRLQVSDALVNEMMRHSDIEEERALTRFLGLFRKREICDEAGDDVVAMLERYHAHVCGRRNELEAERSYFAGKRFLSPEDAARRLRIEAELRALAKYDKVKRK